MKEAPDRGPASLSDDVAPPGVIFGCPRGRLVQAFTGGAGGGPRSSGERPWDGPADTPESARCQGDSNALSSSEVIPGPATRKRRRGYRLDSGEAGDRRLDQARQRREVVPAFEHGGDAAARAAPSGVRARRNPPPSRASARADPRRARRSRRRRGRDPVRRRARPARRAPRMPRGTRRRPTPAASGTFSVVASLVPGPAGAGIERPLVQRDEEDRVVAAEDRLRAVAVVHVPVDDRDPLDPERRPARDAPRPRIRRTGRSPSRGRGARGGPGGRTSAKPPASTASIAQPAASSAASQDVGPAIVSPSSHGPRSSDATRST